MQLPSELKHVRSTTTKFGYATLHIFGNFYVCHSGTETGVTFVALLEESYFIPVSNIFKSNAGQSEIIENTYNYNCPLTRIFNYFTPDYLFDCSYQSIPTLCNYLETHFNATGKDLVEFRKFLSKFYNRNDFVIFVIKLVMEK